MMLATSSISEMDALSKAQGDMQQQQQQESSSKTRSNEEPQAVTPKKLGPANQPPMGSPPNSSSKKVAPLIHSRHEWIQQEMEARKRQSISEHDILRLKEDHQRSRGYYFNNSSNNNNNGTTSASSEASSGTIVKDSYGTVRNLAFKFRGEKDTEEQGEQDYGMIHYLSHPSGELSVDSLDAVDRRNLGHARRLSQEHASSSQSDSIHGNNNTTTNDNLMGAPNNYNYNYNSAGLVPLAHLQVADSVFWGFAKSGITEPSQVSEFVHQIKQLHPDATHVPYAWNIPPLLENRQPSSSSMMMDDESDTTPTQVGASPSGYDEDGEPEGSTGPFLLEQVRESRHETEGAWLFPEEVGGWFNEGAPNGPNSSGTAVVVVRYFGKELLGVTCGRLSQCYQRIAQTTLHRLFRGCHVPLHLDFTKKIHAERLVGIPAGNIYGLAAGDTEVHRNVVAGDPHVLMTTLLDELDFGGFRGAQGEVLPRLQNLQADFYQYQDETTNGRPVASTLPTIIPVYRYPGNYQGDEWETFPWSKLSREIKEKVEATLPHFYNQQKMNHCVTNYYRHANDYIAHHSDKDLDLDKKAAIVSVSIGDERILELRRRAEPRDLTRLKLPHGSMLVLGPLTNAYFTHSILPAEDPDAISCEPTAAASATPPLKHDPCARISLTMRHVTTYLDTKSRRLFGEGVELRTLQDLKQSRRWEKVSFVFGFTVLWRSFWHYAANNYTLPFVIQTALPWTTSSVQYTTSSNRSAMLKSLVQESMIVLGSAAVGWWSYCGILRAYHKRKEELAAREFFTKKSTSGTKY